MFCGNFDKNVTPSPKCSPKPLDKLMGAAPEQHPLFVTMVHPRCETAIVSRKTQHLRTRIPTLGQKKVGISSVKMA